MTGCARIGLRIAQGKAEANMCGLCGIFGEKTHWSTQGVAKGTSRRQRFFRLQALNRVLSLVHYAIRDFSGTDYVLCSPTGAQTVVKEMGQMWQDLEKLSGKPLDPLDEKMIAAMLER
jgi:hypothetical protein